jgi:hypothetical protein
LVDGTEAGRVAVIVVSPGESAWAVPVGEIVAMVLSEDAHVTSVVTSALEPSVMNSVHVRATVSPGFTTKGPLVFDVVKLGAAIESAETTGGATTKQADLLTRSTFAVIVTTPARWPCTWASVGATLSFCTEAMAESLDVHVMPGKPRTVPSL